MQMRQVEIFHAVMVHGSTVAAARHLSITQPAVSAALKRIQDEMGLTLFTNNRGRLVPTREAQALFGPVQSLQDDIAQLQRLGERLADGRVGHIRFGTVPALGERVIAHAIAGLHREAQAVRVSVDESNTQDLLHALMAGRFDLVCVFGRHDHLPLRTLHRFEVDVLAAIPEGWMPDAACLPLGELDRHPLAAMSPADPMGRLLEAAVQEAAIVGGKARPARQYAPLIEVRSSRSTLALAREGVAIGIADKVSAFEATGLRLLPLDPPLAIEITLAARPDQASSKAEDRFIAALTASIERALDANTAG